MDMWQCGADGARNLATATELLVVFDMDHTMVGDLSALSDRDNVETNMPWTWWPEGVTRGLCPSEIVPYLQRGMLRPGLLELLSHLRLIGATIVVYTHSEDSWAVKVCQALERMAGWPFIHRVYSRMDCRDGHSEFKARKSLQYIVDDLRLHDDLEWVCVNKTILFDDDPSALAPHEAHRLVIVPSYDHWENCEWDQNVTEDMLARNPAKLANIVRASVVEWGIAPPSYAHLRTGHVPELTSGDLKWATKMRKRTHMLLAYNELARQDRIMYDVLHALSDLSDLKALPQMVRSELAKVWEQPVSCRVPKPAIQHGSPAPSASGPDLHNQSRAEVSGPEELPVFVAPSAAACVRSIRPTPAAVSVPQAEAQHRHASQARGQAHRPGSSSASQDLPREQERSRSECSANRTDQFKPMQHNAEKSLLRDSDSDLSLTPPRRRTQSLHYMLDAL